MPSIAPPTTRQELLLPQELLGKLDAIDLLSRKMLAGKMRGERKSKRRGQSVEFADFRNYTTGDDLRFIDWNIYARLDKLFLKLFLEEEDLSIYIIIDQSASMNFGDPNKALYARRVAAALAYIGLVHHNRVSLFGIRQGQVVESGPMRGRPRVPRMLDFLTKLTPTSAADSAASAAGSGDAQLGPALRRVTMTARLKGIAILLSDFIDKQGHDVALKYISSGKYDLFAIQLLSPGEIDPTIQGDLKLVDAEDRTNAEVSVSAPLLKQYKATLNAHCLGLKDYVTRRGGNYLFASTAVPFDALVLTYLRRRGLLA